MYIGECSHELIFPYSFQLSQLHYEFCDGPDQTASREMRLCLRRVVVMLLMVVSFAVFWYPLFVLTLLDVHYHQSPQAYRACMVLAWAQPITTPVFCGVIYFDIISMERLRAVDYTSAIPMRDSTSFSSTSGPRDEARHRAHAKYRLYDTGFTNENFSFSNQGSPCTARTAGAQSPPTERQGEGQGHVLCQWSVDSSSSFRSPSHKDDGSQHTLIM